MLEFKSYRMVSMPYAQCNVTIGIDDGVLRSVELTSYNTLVISIFKSVDDKKWRILCTGTYSPTTIKHINKFIKEFFGENLYHYCKEISGLGGKLLPKQDYDRVIKRAFDYKNDNCERKVKRFYGEY